VARGERLVGIVDEASLLAALAQGLDPNSPVELVMDPDPVLIEPHMAGAEALRVFNETGRHAIAVVDVMGNAIGVLTPSRLFHPQRTSYRPQIVGGLATPFGVYLTNGVVSGGARGFALVAAGSALFLTFFLAMVAVVGAVNAFDLRLPLGFADFATILLFLVGLRVMPLSGTHGAEHMVVHAIERGEELTPEVVRRMPRVHPRCGTNIAVGAMLFLGVFQAPWPADDSLRLLLALLATLFLWRPLGSFVQYFFTTKRPTDAQLLSGIKAGRELLAASQSARRARPSPLSRFASSGILHVMAGAVLAEAATYGVLALLNLPKEWQVLSLTV
jgi:CBS domain-containing protein